LGKIKKEAIRLDFEYHPTPEEEKQKQKILSRDIRNSHGSNCEVFVLPSGI